MFEDSDSAFNSDLDSPDRRQALKYGLVGALAASVPLLGMSSPAEARSTWRVTFKNVHTGERYNGVYRVGSQYIPESFDKMNHVLRDFRTGEVFPMDPRVIDILASIQRKMPRREAAHILSGYRSPKTNNGLRKNTRGVAKNSFHMYGQALDIHFPSVSTSRLKNMASSCRAGGVGYYPKSGFVHVDTGKVRNWTS